MTGSIVKFYSGDATDHRGRSLEEILGWSDQRLEAVHDFIQWLFPLPQPSPVNPYAPILTPATIQAFHARPELRARMRASLERMLRFYGFELRSEPWEVVASAAFPERAANWVHPGNHNHLRITRILQCCALTGLEPEARAFLHCLEAIYADQRRQPRPGITPESLTYWRAALGS